MTTTTSSTTLAPLVSKSTTTLALNKQQNTRINENDKLKLQPQSTTLSPLSTTNNKILSTRLSSIGNEFSFNSTTNSTQPKIENLDLQTTTNKPISSSAAKLTDQLTTNSPTLIETTNDISEPFDSNSNAINNEFNEKFNEKLNQTNQIISNQQLASVKTNLSIEFNSSNSLINNSSNSSNSSALSPSNNNNSQTQPSLVLTTNKLTTLSTLNLDSSDLLDNQANYLTLEKKNVLNQDQLINNSLIVTFNNNSLLTIASNNTTAKLNSASTTSSPVISSTTTASPTTLKYIDLLKPLNKTSSSSISHLQPAAEFITEKSTQSTTTTELSSSSFSSSSSTTSNNPSHRIAIVYNPTTSTTTASTTTINSILSTVAPPISNENNQTSSSSTTVESPVNIKSVCGKRLNMPKGRIVGGTKSYFGEWPWMVSLRQWKKNAFLHKCGAALLNEFWAITAAHCVEK